MCNWESYFWESQSASVNWSVLIVIQTTVSKMGNSLKSNYKIYIMSCQTHKAEEIINLLLLLQSCKKSTETPSPFWELHNCHKISVDLPGLLEACRGYDTPSGNPHPSKGFTDPGLSNKILAFNRTIFIFKSFLRKCWIAWMTIVPSPISKSHLRRFEVF